MNTGPRLTRLIHIHSFDNGAVWSFMASFQAIILSLKLKLLQLLPHVTGVNELTWFFCLQE